MDFINKLFPGALALIFVINGDRSPLAALAPHAMASDRSRPAASLRPTCPAVSCAPALKINAPVPQPTRSPRPLMKDSFVLVSGGQYLIGKKNFPENPLRKVTVDPFLIAVFETTNRQFAAFINATGYRTDAEKWHDALVFAPGLGEFKWLEDSTASWRYPNGISRGGIDDKMDHPVTCISYTDIIAYCKWAGVRLPTLEEWEIACRAGSKTDYFFGDKDKDIGKYANIWFHPDHLTADSSDGYMYTSPVGSFAPNPWGLYDMYGNVFEFCSGRVSPTESKTLAHARGGSWWCSARSCHFYNSYDIGGVNVHASFSNQGFRVARLPR